MKSRHLGKLVPNLGPRAIQGLTYKHLVPTWNSRLSKASIFSTISTLCFDIVNLCHLDNSSSYLEQRADLGLITFYNCNIPTSLPWICATPRFHHWWEYRPTLGHGQLFLSLQALLVPAMRHQALSGPLQCRPFHHCWESEATRLQQHL